MKKSTTYTIGFIIGLIILGVISWLITVGLVWLITLCFGWNFSVLGATGVWIILCAFKALMPRSKGEK